MDPLWPRASRVLALAVVCLALPGVSAAQAAGPTLVLTEDCSQRGDGGVQVYGARLGVTGFPPNSEVSGDVGFDIINPDGSLTPQGGGTATVTTDANGDYVNFIGLWGSPVVITLTVGSQSKSIRATCEPEPAQPTPAAAPKPKLAKQCKRGGYRRFKFKSQRQCVAYVRRGPRTR